jgi:hypothetical protein
VRLRCPASQINRTEAPTSGGRVAQVVRGVEADPAAVGHERGVAFTHRGFDLLEVGVHEIGRVAPLAGVGEGACIERAGDLFQVHAQHVGGEAQAGVALEDEVRRIERCGLAAQGFGERAGIDVPVIELQYAPR